MENVKKERDSILRKVTLVAIIALLAFWGNPPELSEVKSSPIKAEKKFCVSPLVKISKTTYLPKQKLSDQDLVTVLRSVGFKGQALKIAWAVAKKESHGRPLAHNQNRKTGDNSYGLFQVNMIGYLGTDRRETFNLKSNSELFNPVKNAEIAYHMSNRGKIWTAWNGLTKETREWLKRFPDNKSY